MRKIIVLLLVAFCALSMATRADAGSYQGAGNYVGTPSSAVTALFNQFPNGGDGLVAAIRDLLIANPGLADDVAFVAGQSSPAQQDAAGAGMGQAYIALSGQGNTSGMGSISTASQFSGNAVLATAVTTAQSFVASTANLYGSGSNTNPATVSCTSTTVSPTSSTSGC